MLSLPSPEEIANLDDEAIRIPNHSRRRRAVGKRIRATGNSGRIEIAAVSHADRGTPQVSDEPNTTRAGSLYHGSSSWPGRRVANRLPQQLEDSGNFQVQDDRVFRLSRKSIPIIQASTASRSSEATQSIPKSESPSPFPRSRILTSTPAEHDSLTVVSSTESEISESRLRNGVSPELGTNNLYTSASTRDPPSSEQAQSGRKRTADGPILPDSHYKRLLIRRPPGHRVGCLERPDEAGWLVEEVLADRRVGTRNGWAREYRIKWRGRPDSENTWVSEQGLVGADALLKDYRTAAAMQRSEAGRQRLERSGDRHRDRPRGPPLRIEIEDSDE